MSTRAYWRSLSVADDADGDCEEFGRNRLTINGVPTLTPEGVTLYSGGWQDASGRWFLPTGPGDPRLPGSAMLDFEERQQAAGLRAQIGDQLAGLDAALERAPSSFCCKPGHGSQRETLYGM